MVGGRVEEGVASVILLHIYRCGNVAAIFELDENLNKKYTIFEAAPNVRLCNK